MAKNCPKSTQTQAWRLLNGGSRLDQGSTHPGGCVWTISRVRIGHRVAILWFFNLPPTAPMGGAHCCLSGHLWLVQLGKCSNTTLFGGKILNCAPWNIWGFESTRVKCAPSTRVKCAPLNKHFVPPQRDYFLGWYVFFVEKSSDVLPLNNDFESNVPPHNAKCAEAKFKWETNMEKT